MIAFAADGEHRVSINRVDTTAYLSSCPDSGCTTSPLPVAAVDNSATVYPAVAVRHGRVAVVGKGTGPDIVTLQLCADPACTRIGRRVDISGLANPARLSLRVLPDGRPVILAGGDLVTCTDPDCNSTAVTQVVPPLEGGVTQPVLGVGRNGLPMVVSAYLGLWLYTCTDPLCTTPTKRVVSTSNPGTVPPVVAQAADGAVYVASLSRKAMTLFRCTSCG